VSALLLLVVPWSLAHDRQSIDERRPADPQGSVEIVNVAGSVEVSGWDRPEVEVTGTAGDQVERVEVTSSGTTTSIHVQSRSGMSLGSSAEAHLIVRVPAKSSITATLVSADLKLSGVQGDVNFQTVSGDVSGNVGGNVHASTVSGGVQMTAESAKSIEITTISGDILLTGGGGEVDITTVSGDAQIELGTVSWGRLKTVSGDMSTLLTLAPDAKLEAESVSGNVRFEFPSAPAAEFDVQSFSGDIHNCFGPKPTETRYGPGSRLTFNNGDGHAHVRIATKSGDVNLCAKGGHLGRVSAAPGTPCPAHRVQIMYVI
jgi:DUF4097 and DUF4098 domain-containing protein YvlB